jgi:hypothetical protein
MSVRRLQGKKLDSAIWLCVAAFSFISTGLHHSCVIDATSTTPYSANGQLQTSKPDQNHFPEAFSDVLHRKFQPKHAPISDMRVQQNTLSPCI